MNKKEKRISLEEAKKQTSELIFKVLSNNLCVREAIKLFPPDTHDPSIECAWHALVHYEADDEYRKKDPQYAEEQDHYLEMIGALLRDGKNIPVNIIQSYNKYYDMTLIPRGHGFWSLLKYLFRFIT